MATTDYDKVYKLAEKQVKEALAAEKSPYPAVLEERLESWTAGQGVSLGVLDIPTELIVGTCTSGRQNLFSYGFLPLAKKGSEFATKWEALYASQLSEGMREPIVVFEYLQHFYVQEGNKRVSVARVLKMPSIEAQVYRVMPKPDIGEEYERYQEFICFWHVCPLYGLEFSEASSYKKLARLFGCSLDEPWSEEDIHRLKALLALLEEGLAQIKSRPKDATLADCLLTYLEYYPQIDVQMRSTGLSKQELIERLKFIWPEQSSVDAAMQSLSSASHEVLHKARDVAQVPLTAVESGGKAAGQSIAKIAGSVGDKAVGLAQAVSSSVGSKSKDNS